MVQWTIACGVQVYSSQRIFGERDIDIVGDDAPILKEISELVTAQFTNFGQILDSLFAKNLFL